MFSFPHGDNRPAPGIVSQSHVMNDRLGAAMDVPDLPEITVTTTDELRLAQLIGDFFHIRNRQIAFLARELDRASVVDSAAIQAGVVTMHSVAEFRDAENGCLSRATLVYPAEIHLGADAISILAPVGTALLGLSEGQCMPYEAEDGSVRRVTIHRVLFQPEAERLRWL